MSQLQGNRVRKACEIKACMFLCTFQPCSNPQVWHQKHSTLLGGTSLKTRTWYSATKQSHPFALPTSFYPVADVAFRPALFQTHWTFGTTSDVPWYFSLHFSFLQKTGLCLLQCCCMEPFGQDLIGQVQAHPSSYRPSAWSFQDQTTFQTQGCTKHVDAPSKMTFPLSRFWPAWRLAPRTLRKLRWRHTSRQSPLSEPVICKGGRDHSRVTNKELSPGPQLNKFDVLECNCDPGRPSKTFRFYAVKGSHMLADLLKRTEGVLVGGLPTKFSTVQPRSSAISEIVQNSICSWSLGSG